ncbi:IS1 family transposase, partial [Klebsiella quasipneumoniae]
MASVSVCCPSCSATEGVMRNGNGKILGWAWGAGFVDGIGQGMERASQPAVGL